MRFSGVIEGLLGGRMFKRASRDGYLEYSGGVIYRVTMTSLDGGEPGDVVKSWVRWEPSQENLLAQDWEHFTPWVRKLPEK